ncbi:MAG TPA: TonB-dependent receptor [Sphingobium sp.]|nr:TonB-dependent receptor [Sphingobium sp.]
MKPYLLSTASIIIALAAHGSAFAQEAAASGESAAPQSGISDIVVTAQRRSENIQRSSLSIQVVTGEDLIRRGVTEARDLAQTNPSISVAQTGGFTQTNIRGAGDFAGNGLAQPAVSYSVDGVVIGQTSAISHNFYDLARVEVLTGPQGTLYGRNATGGAVNLLTNRPTQEFGGYVTADYGNYDSKRLTGALNVPLASTLAVRGAFNLIDGDGYLSDGTDDDVRQAARLQAYWEPSEDVNLRLYGDYAHIGGNGAGAVLWPPQPGTGTRTSVTDPINQAILQFTSAGTAVEYAPDSAYIDQTQWDFSAELNVRLGDFATLTVLPGYRYLKLRNLTNAFGLQLLQDPQVTKQTTLEARLGNQSDRLKWTAGVFYFNDRTDFDQFGLNTKPNAGIQLFSSNSNIQSLNRSYAAFAEGTFSVTPEFRVIAGGRYTRDLVRFSGFVADLAVPAAVGSPFDQDGRKVFKAFTWKGGFEYDVGPTSMLYFTAAKGYKAGGFFYVPEVNDDNNYRPERLTSFDLGIRNRFFNNTLQLNLAAYYWQYRDQQNAAAGYTSTGTIAYATRNIGSANPYGAVADIIWQPTANDSLSVNVNYNHARYSKFVIQIPEALLPTVKYGAPCSLGATPITTGSATVRNLDCAGAPLPRTPDWSGAVNYQHKFPLAGGADVIANVGGTFASSRYLSSEFYSPNARDKGYVLLNADLTYTAPDNVFSITAYVRNITNNAVYSGSNVFVENGFRELFGIGPSPDLVFRSMAPPRTYGVRATVNF